MKKYIILFASAIFLFAGCFQDESTPATFDYPDIVITKNFESDTLSVNFGAKLTISAVATQEGVDESKLEYLWEMDVQPGTAKGRAFLSDTPDVDVRITSSPSAMPYYVSLTVTNTESGFSRSRYWPLYVINALGEGILVAHTSDGGVTSDLSLLANKHVTYGYVSDKPRVTDNLFEIGNGTHIDGKVTSLLARSATDLNAPVRASYNEDLIMVGTEEHVYALDPVSYSVKRSDAALFASSTVTSFGVDMFHNVGNYSSFVLMDGNIYVCIDMLDNTYTNTSYPISPRQLTPSNTAAAEDNQGWVYTFDPTSHRFYYVPGWCIHSSAFAELEEKASPEKTFLDDKVSVACGIFKGIRGAFVLKGTDGYWLTVLSGNDGAAPVVAKLDAPNIENATDFAFCDNTDVFFYIADNKVYSTVLSGGSASTRVLSWNPDSKDEKVTMIKHYRQGWYGTRNYDLYGSGSTNYAFPLSTHRMQMAVVTYNEKTGEGKIYLKPFNVSTGMFNAFKDNGTYGGFGQITAIGTTLR